jgi:hypothetical protein
MYDMISSAAIRWASSSTLTFSRNAWIVCCWHSIVDCLHASSRSSCSIRRVCHPYAGHHSSKAQHNIMDNSQQCGRDRAHSSSQVGLLIPCVRRLARTSWHRLSSAQFVLPPPIEMDLQALPNDLALAQHMPALSSVLEHLWVQPK